MKFLSSYKHFLGHCKSSLSLTATNHAAHGCLIAVRIDARLPSCSSLQL